MEYLFKKSKCNNFYEKHYSNQVCKPFASLEEYLNSALAGEKPYYCRFDKNGKFIKEELEEEIANVQFCKCNFLFYANSCFNKGYKKSIPVKQLGKYSYFIYNQACILFCINAVLGRYGELYSSEFQCFGYLRFADCIIRVIQSYFIVLGKKEDKEKHLTCLIHKRGYFKQLFTIELVQEIISIAKKCSLKNISAVFKNRKTFSIYNKYCREDKELFEKLKNKHKDMKLTPQLKETIISLKEKGYSAAKIKKALEPTVSISTETIYRLLWSIKNGKEQELEEKKIKMENLFNEITELYLKKELKSYKQACEFFHEKTGRTLSISAMSYKIKQHLEDC